VRVLHGASYVVADNYFQAYHAEITKALHNILLCATGATLDENDITVPEVAATVIVIEGESECALW